MSKKVYILNEQELSHEEIELIAEALTHLQHANIDYLTWKTDEYSQKQIPITLSKINVLYGKIHKIRTQDI